ncbi:hypothetical protein [Pedobacter sp. NJ-S-72]
MYIVVSLIPEINIVANSTGISLLQMENDRLQTLLLHYQEAQDGIPVKDPGVIAISKPVFYVLATGVIFMIALLSYFLLFKEPAKPVKKELPVKETTVPAATNQDDKDKGYSWDKDRDSLNDSGTTETQPIQIKPVPQTPRDTTTMNLDTTLHF